MIAPRKKRRNLQSDRKARLHQLYSSDDVIKLYDISRNTLTNWIAEGLIVIDAEPRLFRGSDLNAFHGRRRKKAAGAPLGQFLVNCFSCKRSHSLLEGEVSIRPGRTDALFLFGVRDGSLISLRLKHVDIDRRQVFQDAREVKTKFSKTSIVDWFPVGEDIETTVTDWIEELKSMGAGYDAPLFPTAPFKPWIGRHSIELEFLTTAAPVRRVLRKAAAAAGVPYFKPHAVRSTVAKLCDGWASSMRDMKALSQNLGHEHVSTTSKYYGDVEPDVKQELFQKMRDKQRNPSARDIGELAEQVRPEMQDMVRKLLQMELDRK